MREQRRADARHDFRIQRLVEVDDHQLAIRRYVSMRPRNDDVVRSSQRAVRVERAVWVTGSVKLTLQIIVQRITVQQRSRIHDD